MPLYEFVYDMKESEDSEFTYNRKYQIPADTERDALVRLGQLHSEERVIKVISVIKVFN